jgi:hypothetical protein
VLALTPEELNAVFDPEHVKEFDKVAEARVARMRAPFFGHVPKSSGDVIGTLSLYAEQDHD